MNDTVTIMGFIGNDPQSGKTTGGVAVLNFRVGSTQRRYDAKSGAWIDSGTNWYSVAAYRFLADHARDSLRKGDPVIVTGRLRVREWDNGSGVRGTALDLDAEAIGHDLRWGASSFMRAHRAGSGQSAQAQENTPVAQTGTDSDTWAVSGDEDVLPGSGARVKESTAGAWITDQSKEEAA